MNNNQLSDLYKIRFPKEELPRKNAIWKIICNNFLQRYIDHNSTVIDVACGYGEFLNNINATRKIAIDLNPDAKDHLNGNIEFNILDATQFSTVAPSKADIVFTSNFLEHLPNKKILDLFLDEVKKSLKPGGKFIILGPNLRYLPGKYWDFYDHHLGLTHLSLSEVLKLKSFDIEVCIDKFLPYTTKGPLPTHPFFVWLYLHLPFTWKLFGKQFFIVARKL